jgi:hypothetical protein
MRLVLVGTCSYPREVEADGVLLNNQFLRDEE